MTARLRIGIIGRGALAQELTRHLAQHTASTEIVGYLARNKSGQAMPAECFFSLHDFLAQKPDLVVECAGQAATVQYALPVIQAGAHYVPASVGALADDMFRARLVDTARSVRSQIRLPTGAVVGIDGLAAARHTPIDEVLYRGTMSPSTLRGHYDGDIPDQGLVFSGSAREAVKRFPKNANLTGTIALAGIGFDRTRVEMHVDPSLNANVHELIVRGHFGAFDVKVSGLRISDTSPSSRIVAGSLAQAVLGSTYLLL